MNKQENFGEWCSKELEKAQAEIAELRANLSALESAKPLAVLPLPDIPPEVLCGYLDEGRGLYAHWQPEKPIQVAKQISDWFHSRIQPVPPEYIAALEFYVKDHGDEIAQEDTLAHINRLRARLAAGKGGE